MQTKYVYLVIIALLALISDVFTARILGLFPHIGRSHHTVFEPLLRELAERGHHVTVVSFFPTKNPPNNYTDVSLEGIAPVAHEIIDMSEFEKSNRVIDLLGFGKTLQQAWDFRPLADIALNVCEKLIYSQSLHDALQKKYDVLIVESFNSDCMLGLTHIYGINVPVISLLSSAMVPWASERIGVSDNPSYVPITCSDFATRMTFLERLENTLAQLFLKLWFRYSIQVKEQAILEQRYGRKIPDLNDLAKNTSLMLVNTFHSLTGVTPSIPGLVEVAGMHLDSTKKDIPCYIHRFLEEAEHGVVLFSFGSLINTSTMSKSKEDMIVKVLSKLKQRVIWKYEESDEEGTHTGNILKVKWIPLYELLQNKKVVAIIAHGGMSTTIEATAAGKPMLLMPFFGDQTLNGATAEYLGIAKVISYNKLTEELFSEALDAVLGAKMRLNSRRMAQIWQDRPLQPLDNAVYWVERVIRWGVQDKLHSPARDLTFIEYTLLDIVAAFVGTVIVLVIMMRIFLSIVAGYLKPSSKKNKEKVN